MLFRAYSLVFSFLLSASLKSFDALLMQVTEHFPDYIVLPRKRVMQDIDKVIGQMIQSQIEMTQTMNPLLTILGAVDGIDADSYMKNRIKEAMERLAKTTTGARGKTVA